MATSSFGFGLGQPGGWLAGQMRNLFSQSFQQDPAQYPVATKPPSNYDEAFAAALMSGGNNDLNPESIRRVGLLNVQRDAARQYAMGQGRSAVEELKRQQWMTGGRTLADEEAGEVAPAYAAGVRNGVAFDRNGQPVGFAGAIPGMNTGVSANGFNPAGQDAFRKELWARVNASDQPQQVAAMPQIQPTSFGVTPQGLPDDTPEAASRGARTARDMPFAPIAAQDAARNALMGGPTIADLQSDKANTERGMAARGELQTLETSIPKLLAELTAEAGLAVDEDVLATEILTEPKNAFEKSIPAKYRKVGQFAARLGVDPKVLIRWAQDRKKKKAA